MNTETESCKHFRKSKRCPELTHGYRDSAFMKSRIEPLEAVVSIRFSRSYKRECICEFNSVTRVEAGSNTSTVTMRVVGVDEKGSLESETVKYGHESYATRTRK
jgi:hypothetical protein